MEKPSSMSVKDWLVKKMSIDLVTKESVINAVVMHQFNSVNDALKNNKSIEISGFGKFVLLKKKAIRKLEKYYAIKKACLDKLEDDPANKYAQRKIDSVSEQIDILENKLNNGWKD
jgi:hypothetical protein